ncbi:hypothetical protein EV361DRAFT_952311 [Lentinula raphanica]|nr:hypothetical protein EV361DRAFT_952311 [Lentinula raphanica]
MGDSPSLNKRKNPPDPRRDNETTPKGPRTKSIHVTSSRSSSPTPQNFKNTTAERAATRREGRFDPTKPTVSANSGIPRRSTNNSTALPNERDGRDSQMSNYSEPGPMDQDWDHGVAQNVPYYHSAPACNEIGQSDAALLTGAIFFSMEQLVRDLSKAIRQGSLPSNFDEQVGHTGVALVNLLAQIGVRGGDTDDKVSRALAKLTDSFAEARKSDSARLSEIERRLQIGTPESGRPNWADNSYAAKAAANTTANTMQTNRGGNTGKRPTEKTTKELERASQFVVHFPEVIPEEMHKDPCSITRDINTFIALHPNLGKTRVYHNLELT